jgi:hypothetical protein
MLYSLFFMLFKFLLTLFATGPANVLLTVLTAVSMILFMRDLVRSSNDATMRIIAHLLAIRNAGINARTTPVFQKHLLYRRFQLIIIAGSVELLIEVCLTEFLELAFVSRELLDDCFVAMLLAALAVVFRLRTAGAVSYGRIADEGSAQEILLSDLDGIDVGTLDSGRDWVDGMALPAPPEIVRERHTAEAPTDLVLASPDGTATIQASVVRQDP